MLWCLLLMMLTLVSHASLSTDKDNSPLKASRLTEPRFEEIFVSDIFDIIVRFDRGTDYEDVEYNVAMLDRNTSICTTNCSSFKNSSLCECRNNPNYMLGIRHMNTTFSIKAARPGLQHAVQIVEVRKSFNLFHYIVPGCVEDLKLFMSGSNESTIVFKVQKYTNRIISYMHASSMPLMYHIVLHQLEGVPAKTELLVPVKVPRPSTGLGNDHLIAVRFPNLNANTRYQVTVAGLGGGGQGGKKTLNFTTNKAAPAAPPDIDEFSFTRVSINSTDFILVMWKELPQAVKGDISVSYKVTVTGSNGVTYSREVSEPYHYINSQHVSFPAYVQIWAVNQQGISANKSEIVVPEITKTPSQVTVVEFTRDDKANIFVNLSNFRQSDQLLIHWCHWNSDENLCYDYPQTKVQNVSSTLQVVMAINVNKVTEKEMIEIEMFEFNQIENLPEPRKVNATKIVNPSDADPQDPDPFSFAREDALRTTRRRRSKKLKHRNWRRLKKSAAVMSPEVGTKFYVSYKVRGNWSGMVPSSCYFDRKKSTAKIMTQIVEENGKENLRMWQECNKNEPENFLIEKFNVYSSTDKYCKRDKQKLKTVINEVFNWSMLEIPASTKFLCIEGVGADGETDVTEVPIPPGSTENIFLIIGIGIGTVLILLTLGTILRLVCACWERKNHFDDMHWTDSDKVYSNTDVTCGTYYKTTVDDTSGDNDSTSGDNDSTSGDNDSTSGDNDTNSGGNNSISGGYDSRQSDQQKALTELKLFFRQPGTSTNEMSSENSTENIDSGKNLV